MADILDRGAKSLPFTFERVGANIDFDSYRTAEEVREVIIMGENQEDIGQAVKVYKALGEPTRLKIALLLAKESNLCFTAVGERLESVAGSTLSHHLKQLTDSGLIDSRKNGSFIHYNVNREIAEKFAPFLLA